MNMNRKQLEKFFSNFWNIDIKKIKKDLKLGDVSLKDQSSVRYYQFIAAIESNFDVKVINLNNIITFEDLYKNMKPNK